jgi:hypothetical protein
LTIPTVFLQHQARDEEARDHEKDNHCQMRIVAYPQIHANETSGSTEMAQKDEEN